MVVGSGVWRAAADHCLARRQGTEEGDKGWKAVIWKIIPGEEEQAHTRFNSRDSGDKLRMRIRIVRLTQTACLLPVLILFGYLLLC